MELLIPSGPIPARREAATQSYAAVASLARVNREMKQHIDVLVYQSANRRCQIQVSGFVQALMHLYRYIPQPTGEIGTVVRSKRPIGTVCDLSDLVLTKFAHYDLRCSGIIPHAVLLHVMFAISSVRSNSSPSATGVPHLNLTCVFGAWFWRGGTTLGRLERLLKSARETLQIVSSFAVNVEWTFEIKIEQNTENEMTSFVLQKKQLQLSGPALPPRVRSDLVKRCAPFRLWAWAAIPSYWAAAKLPRWQRYLRVIEMTRSLLDLKYLIDPYFEAGSDFMDEAQAAFESGTLKTTGDHLLLLERRVGRGWNDFVKHQQDKVDKLRGYFRAPTGSQPIQPRDIVNGPLLPRKLRKVVDAHSVETEKEAPPWAKIFWSSAIVHSNEERFYDWDSLPESLKALKIHHKCSGAAARLVRSQSKLLQLPANTINQHVEQIMAERRSEVNTADTGVQLKITQWIQVRKSTRR